MWDRKDLKAKGKIAFKANYWRSVLVAFLATALTSSGSSAGANNASKQVVNNGTFDPNSTGLTNGQMMLVLGSVAGIVIVAIIIVIALDIFVINPLTVGCDNFFLMNRKNPSTDLSSLERGFKPSYKPVVKTIFMRDLFITLWTLVFIIPGIIKALEYRLVPYIVSENPDIDYKEALQRSKDLMYGNKWKAFVLDLSFIGWIILGCMTLGLLNLFYVQPYMNATNAELYVALAHPEESNTVLKYEGMGEDVKTVEFEVE